MEGLKIKSILVYNINQKDIIIGILKDISQKESLENIRQKIKKMTLNNNFISLKENQKIEIIDQDIESDFLLEDIIINENGVFKIFINGQNNKELNNNYNNMENNNINQMHNYQMNIDNNNFNNFKQNIFNPFPLEIPNQFINNNMNNFNNMNNMNNMSNFNSLNNMNNMSNFNSMNNMCNCNNMNNFNNMSNMNNFNNMSNFNNMNDFNNVNERLMNLNLNNMNGPINNNMNNINNFHLPLPRNKINNNDNEQNEENLKNKIIKYKVTVKLSHGFKFNLEINHLDKIYDVESIISRTLNLDNIHIGSDNNNAAIKIFYNKEEIFCDDYSKRFEPVHKLFKDDPNPSIIIEDKNYLIRPINIFFRNNNDKNTEIKLLINYNTTIKDLLFHYLREIDHYSYDDESLKDKIDFIYNKKKLNYDDETTVEKFFNIENSLELIKQGKNMEKIIFINDKHNLIKIFNVTFKDNHGYEEEIKFGSKRKVDELLEIYLNKINHNEITKLKEIIQFIYKQKNLKIEDKTSISDFFLNDKNPIIQVIDSYNLLLKAPILKYSVTFKTTSGAEDNSSFYIYYNMNIIISNYLDYKDHPELKNKKNLINFLYNGNQINEKESLCECFKNDFHPVILVMDPNNLLRGPFQNGGDQKLILIFTTTEGCDTSLGIQYETTIDKLLKIYLWRVGESERAKQFVFIYNASQLKFGDQRFVEDVFCHLSYIRITVLST